MNLVARVDRTLLFLNLVLLLFIVLIRVPPEQRRAERVRTGIGEFVYAAVFGVAFINAPIALAITAATAIYHVLAPVPRGRPPSRSDRPAAVGTGTPVAANPSRSHRIASVHAEQAAPCCEVSPN